MEEELRLLGLIDVEIKIFLTLIKIGETLASDIAKKANVPRGSIYDILERLEKKGLVSHIIKDHNKFFSATNPKTILEDLDYKKQRIKDILPQLEQLKKYSDAGVSKSEIYTGKEGMKTILNMVLEEKEIFVLGASRKTTEVLPYFMGHWFKERARRRIKAKIIYNDTPTIRKSIKEHKENLYITKEWEMKFLHVNYLSDIMTVAFGDKVMLATWKKEEPSATLIQNKDIAETYKEYILNLWKIAKK